MAMKKPIIISVPDGESTQIIKENNCGLVTLPENAMNLSNAIKRLKQETTLYEELAQNSLKASRLYNRETLAKNMLMIIEELIIKKN